MKCRSLHPKPLAFTCRCEDNELQCLDQAKTDGRVVLRGFFHVLSRL